MKLKMTLKPLQRPPVRCIVWDEAHHHVAESYRVVARWWKRQTLPRVAKGGA